MHGEKSKKKTWNNYNSSFTLAEVLITLGIIGVVAAMTLPALIQKQNEKATVVQLKKAYSMLSQAVLAEIAENGTVDNWNLGNTDIGLKDDNGNSILDNTGREKFAQILKKHLKVISTPQEGDFQFYTLDGTYLEALSKDNAIKNMVMTPDGTIYNVGYTNIAPECRKGLYHCIDMVIMLKPEKGKYIQGKNMFYFGVYKDRVVPAGTQDSPAYTFENHCVASSKPREKGRGCSAWVVLNENMDYLHCPDKLGWDKAKSCKD